MEGSKARLTLVPSASPTTSHPSTTDGFPGRIRSMSAACELLGITWDEPNAIKQRVVARGVKRRKSDAPRYKGVDAYYGRNRTLGTMRSRTGFRSEFGQDSGINRTVNPVGIRTVFRPLGRVSEMDRNGTVGVE